MHHCRKRGRTRSKRFWAHSPASCLGKKSSRPSPVVRSARARIHSQSTRRATMASANSTKLGALLDKLWAKRRELTKAKAAAKKLEKEFNTLQEQVFRDFKKA